MRLLRRKANSEFDLLRLNVNSLSNSRSAAAKKAAECGFD